MAEDRTSKVWSVEICNDVGRNVVVQVIGLLVEGDGNDNVGVL